MISSRKGQMVTVFEKSFLLSFCLFSCFSIVYADPMPMPQRAPQPQARPVEFAEPQPERRRETQTERAPEITVRVPVASGTARSAAINGPADPLTTVARPRTRVAPVPAESDNAADESAVTRARPRLRIAPEVSGDLAPELSRNGSHVQTAEGGLQLTAPVPSRGPQVVTRTNQRTALRTWAEFVTPEARALVENRMGRRVVQGLGQIAQPRLKALVSFHVEGLAKTVGEYDRALAASAAETLMAAATNTHLAIMGANVESVAHCMNTLPQSVKTRFATALSQAQLKRAASLRYATETQAREHLKIALEESWAEAMGLELDLAVDALYRMARPPCGLLADLNIAQSF